MTMIRPPGSFRPRYLGQAATEREYRARRVSRLQGESLKEWGHRLFRDEQERRSTPGMSRRPLGPGDIGIFVPSVRLDTAQVRDER